VRKVHETLAPYAHSDPEPVNAAMPVLAQLIRGRPLTEEMWAPDKRAALRYRWVQVLPRSLSPGDRVRVKTDAYTGDQAADNGRTGYVAGLRNGVVVSYDDEGGRGMGHRHPPDKLERQVPITRRVR
jgi:hypothetical protein